MIEFSGTRILHLAVHNVGNKTKGENIVVSESLTEVDEDLNELLTTYFLKPFTKATETYHFTHSMELSYNEIRGISETVFSDTDSFHINSIQVLKHLYDQSNHPQIKAGDVFVAYFNEVIYYGEPVPALGIFKAETKDAFLKVISDLKQMSVYREDGINVKKLDKGCLILDTEAEDGYRVLSVDNNHYDAEYWQKRFLNIDYVRDDNYETRSLVTLCAAYSQDIIGDEGTKKEQLDFLNESVNYLNENENLKMEEFTSSMFSNKDDLNQFNLYREAFEEENEMEFSAEFSISKPALNKQKRALKNFIQLDTHIQIKLDFRHPESREYIESGYDPEKKMKYYKVFYNEEVN